MISAAAMEYYAQNGSTRVELKRELKRELNAYLMVPRSVILRSNSSRARGIEVYKLSVVRFLPDKFSHPNSLRRNLVCSKTDC